jgi:hypothetical protein
MLSEFVSLRESKGTKHPPTREKFQLALFLPNHALASMEPE